MFIVVESGATKTAWRAVWDDGSVRAVQTAGLSPTCLDLEHTQEIVRKAIPELNPEGKHVDEIFFYGAGLVSPQSCAAIEEALQMWCPLANVHFLFRHSCSGTRPLRRRQRSCSHHGHRIQQLPV